MKIYFNKSQIQHIIKEEIDNNNFIPTVEWVRASYAKANKEIFDNKLGECKFECCPLQSAYGQFEITNHNIKADCNTRQMYSLFFNGIFNERECVDRNNFVAICRPLIRINTDFSGPEEIFYMILVHEMCHYATMMYGFYPKQGHGKEFKEYAKLVAEKTNGKINITTFMNLDGVSILTPVGKTKEKLDKKLKNGTFLIVQYPDHYNLVFTNSKETIEYVILYEENNGHRVYEVLNDDIRDSLIKISRKPFRSYRYRRLPNDNCFIKQIFSDKANYTELTLQGKMASTDIINKVNYILVIKDGFDFRIINATPSAEKEIIETEQRNSRIHDVCVYKITNIDVITELLKRGYGRRQRTYSYYKFDQNDEIMKKIFSNSNNYSILYDGRQKVNEEKVKKISKNDYIDIEYIQQD